MKAFEDWFKEWHDGRMATVRGTAKDAWRSALKWYRDTMDEIEARDLPLHGREVIEQELEDPK